MSSKTMLITGTRKGIGRYLAEYYLQREYKVLGCSREGVDYSHPNYEHFCLDVTDEKRVKELFSDIHKRYKSLDILVNNAGIASMNHILMTPVSSVDKILRTNFMGTFIFSREAAKIMQRNHFGRIVNFTTVAVPLAIEGESIYAASKSAVLTFTKILAREVAAYGITANAIGPAPVKTDLIRNVPQQKLDGLLERQSIKRFGEFSDVSNVVDFFIRPESDFVTGQVIYLGGV